MTMIEQSFRTESPFIDNDVREIQGDDAHRWVSQSESPFLNEYQLDADEEVADAANDAVAELYSELYDEEFEAATADVVDELSELTPNLFASETFDPSEQARAGQVMRQALEPVAQAAEAFLSEAEARFASLDERSLSAGRALEILNEIEPQGDFASPAFEQLFGGLARKFKKVVSGAVNLAKKGVAALASPLLKPILGKLKTIVRPLLDKVLKFALNKIPAKYRPLATMLANKLQGKVRSAIAKATASDSARTAAPAPAAPSSSEPDTTAATPSEPTSLEPAASTEPASADVGALQQDMDQQLLELLVSRDSEFMGEAPNAPEQEWEDHPTVEVERARARFVNELEQHVARGESPEPAIENFLPAVLLAVRTGIKLIGRQKVVSFLGGLLAKLIGPLIGKQAAPALGNMIADVGLKTLLQAEASPEERRTAVGHAIAATVEETARALTTLPERVLDTPELFELAAMEAFDTAAAANFPSDLIKPELRESESSGAWVMLPLAGRKLYKKFSRVFDVSIPAQVAASIPTFGGSSLNGFLRDCLRIRPGTPIAARIHLYEAIPNTRLGHIARLEKIRGLGVGTRDAASLFHPLTPKAAATLLRSPRLGREVPDDADPLRPTLGQRFYYLEVPEAPARPIGRRSHLHVTANFAKDQVGICLYLSETLAQKAAEALRKGSTPTAVVRDLRSAVGPNALALSAGNPGKRVRLILGSRTLPNHAGLSGKIQHTVRASVRRALGAAAVEWLWLRLSEHLQTNAAAFISATEGPEDGVRVCMKFTGIGGFSALRGALLKGSAPANVEFPPKNPPSASITISAGPKHA